MVFLNLSCSKRYFPYQILISSYQQAFPFLLASNLIQDHYANEGNIPRPEVPRIRYNSVILVSTASFDRSSEERSFLFPPISCLVPLVSRKVIIDQARLHRQSLHLTGTFAT